MDKPKTLLELEEQIKIEHQQEWLDKWLMWIICGVGIAVITIASLLI